MSVNNGLNILKYFNMKQNKIPEIMEEMSKNFKGNEKLEISLTGNVGFADNSPSSTLEVFGYNSSGNTPNVQIGTFEHVVEQKLLDVVVNKDTIEHIYKRVLYNANSLLNNQSRTEIFKKIYSRKDESEKEVIGTFIPEQPESYEF